jgi:hypothetical protein
VDDQLQLLFRNAQQMLSIAKETFSFMQLNTYTPSDICGDKPTEADAIACRWNQLHGQDLKKLLSESSEDKKNSLSEAVIQVCYSDHNSAFSELIGSTDMSSNSATHG